MNVPVFVVQTVVVCLRFSVVAIDGDFSSSSFKIRFTIFHNYVFIAFNVLHVQYINRKEELWIRRLLIWIRLRNVVKWHLSETNFLLMLSWAGSIHKSQGRTLDKAVIDLDTAEKWIL